MLQIRRSEERGAASHGWLDSRHTFSFAHYQDARHNGFGPLRVINEDRVAPGQGFGEHSHRDMEIISYVLDGTLAHRDSMGNGSRLRYGDVQRMSAGAGVRHSEFNASPDAPLHFLQIWIEPNVTGIAPGYEERHFTPESKAGRLRLIASSDGRDGSLPLHQDAALYAVILREGERIEHRLGPGRIAYVHLIRGSLAVNEQALKDGDGIQISAERLIALDQAEQAEALLFDLPA